MTKIVAYKFGTNEKTYEYGKLNLVILQRQNTYLTI